MCEHVVAEDVGAEDLAERGLGGGDWRRSCLWRRQLGRSERADTAEFVKWPCHAVY